MKTSELSGVALDWAVAKCAGVVKGDSLDVGFIREGGYSPSTDWAQGGPIIERERIDLLCWEFHSTPWKSSIEGGTDAGVALYVEYGPTPLIAAMRCYVASKLGDTVDVPEELQ